MRENGWTSLLPTGVQLSDADMEFLEDRAAQREFMGGQSRAEAEAGAIEDYQRWRQHE